MLMSLSHFLASALPLLINVAFVTLLERKILAGCQIRTGPMKNGLMGLFQPFADVVKLFATQVSTLSYSTGLIYLVSPLISIFLSLTFLLCIPLNTGHPTFEFSFMFMVTVLSLNVYPLMLSGWSSNSVYAFLGSVRGVAQTISYEISLAFIIMSLFILLGYNNFNKASCLSTSWKLWLAPLFFMWLISMIAELNRTPFDFSEGESELVSGFNVEYGAVKFAIFFMAEYLMIINLSIISSSIFLGQSFSSLPSVAVSMMLIMVVLWLRATFPRYRYDLLMTLAWKTLLPWTLAVVQLICIMGIFL